MEQGIGTAKPMDVFHTAQHRHVYTAQTVDLFVSTVYTTDKVHCNLWDEAVDKVMT